MIFFTPPPNDYVGKLITLQRWQRDWLQSHRGISNYSGLCQELAIRIIKTNDMAYLKKYEELLETPQRLAERNNVLVKQIFNVC